MAPNIIKFAIINENGLICKRGWCTNEFRPYGPILCYNNLIIYTNNNNTPCLSIDKISFPNTPDNILQEMIKDHESMKREVERLLSDEK
jgi:hypothetical protein